MKYLLPALGYLLPELGIEPRLLPCKGNVLTIILLGLI